MTETITPSPALATGQSLFRGLNYYTEAEADRFFGRNKETQQLYQLIKYNVLTLVFGKSGTGKTSLLNAGVFPLLREDDCLPFPIRLRFGEGNPSLKEQVVQVLTQKIEQDGFSISAFSPDDTLWEFFHREDLWKVITPVLVFDQFEEIFTLLASQSPKTAELTALFTELSDLIENTIPEQIKSAYLQNNEVIPFNYKRQRAKVIFAFREDFLPEMESITSFIPSVKNSRFRLLPMTARQAYEVITKTWRKTIQAAEARKVVFYLTNNEEAGTEELPFQVDTMALFEIEPSLLSQVCSYLEAKRMEENLSRISAEFLQKYPKETILRSIYYDALQTGAASNTTPNGLETDKVQPLKEFLEDNLINEDGYRIKFDKKEIDPNLLPGITLLKSHYFIREEEESVELSHDVVANIVKADRNERRRLQAEAEAKAKARKRAVSILIGAGAVVLIAALVAFFYSKSKIDDANAADLRANAADQRAVFAGKQLDSINASIEKLNNYQIAKPKESIDSNAQYIIDSLIRRSDSLSAENNNLGIQNDSLSNVAKRNKLLSDSNEIYSTNNREIKSQISKANFDRDSVQRIWASKKIYLKMYSTHIDSIFRSREVRDTAELYYHLGVLKKNHAGFKEKLN